MSLEPGEQIDVWVIEERLGSGGMGEVYRCHNAATNRILAAVKVLETRRRSPEAHQRFLREAEILFGLDHTNIVKIRNVRMDSDPPYLEMEFVEGESLEAHIRRGPMPAVEAVRIVHQVLSALQYLHERGVRHRDIKPSNLLLTERGRVVLVDFGLAMEEELGRITAEGLSFGTVSYAPPEWGDPANLDPVQWDLYGVGVLLYELLTGTFAFPLSGEGSMRKQLLQLMLHKQQAEPLDPGPMFPVGLRRLVQQLTAHDASDRPASAREVAGLLERATIDSVAVRTTRTASVPPGRLGRSSPMGWLTALAFVAALAVLGALGTQWLLPRQPPSPTDASPQIVDLSESVLPRTLSVQLTGVPAGLPAWVSAGGAPAPIEQGRASLELDPEARRLVWIVGEGCRTCTAEDCPWCGRGSTPLDPEVGELSLEVSVPTSTVAVGLPLLVDAVGGAPFRPKKKKPLWELDVRLDGAVGIQPNHHAATFAEVLPGKHTLVVSVGECPEEDWGCSAADTCSTGCRSTSQELQVPWGERVVSIDVLIPPP